MSDPAFSNAKDSDLAAAQWLARRNDADWTGAEESEFEAWLAASPVHRVAYLRVEAGWRRAERLMDLPQTEEWRPSAFKLAAAFALVAMLGAGSAYVLLTPRDRTYATPVGGHETVSFADGSRIELNTDTVLRARMTTSERVVWLEKGEAYFQVKHDPAHPFVVMAGERRITDLGTKFVVRQDQSRFQVAVVQGRVWLDASVRQPSRQVALLLPGDVATATAKTMSVRHEAMKTLANQLGWRQGVLVFSHATLAEVAGEFNRYNSRQIVIADPKSANRVIGGTFPARDLDAFTNAVQIAFGLHVRDRGTEIVISP
jgi:transmembrane sensor